jgi:hypothetical protein
MSGGMAFRVADRHHRELARRDFGILGGIVLVQMHVHRSSTRNPPLGIASRALTARLTRADLDLA